ncbi:MBL fold metallo-hydrolase [Salipaludibacillus aurantiacus]|uniref:Glyoxylase, beta-lactamase superfamily II n=1 Tax=Salipaludibacillus aurantiacus TaxID=1601833 RepID=A0A1H9P3P3_9BACI|nr:MBL fold metallo-hydrolase [Salipaludibacillus aurantiacus]SER42535.1 Glyoxylase, beta-lactamase superfamily II [Salipaludibacillus aurantiacus]
MAQRVYSINKHTYLIDGFDLNKERRTGTYVLTHPISNDFSIIETGPSLSVPHIKEGLKELNLSLNHLKNIIVTHIHLDHAGGAGLLLKDCPAAEVFVHPKGARHLADPSRLVTGARAVYGDKFDDLFDPVLPIPEVAITALDDREKILLDAERELLILHTPGHAEHHISIYDPLTNTVFTGDTIGIRYASLEDKGVYLYLPSTSPNQFDPNKMRDSLSTILDLKPETIAFGHFGTSSAPLLVKDQLIKWLDVFTTEGEQAYENKEDHYQLKNTLLNYVSDFLSEERISATDPVYEVIQLDLLISAMGILDYLSKKDKTK